ncbi:efflux RND transporter periplasmic adaptor subunit [Aeoliella sp. ICT_H6.2]|uniref:Efflux RND transporter periplasmic adaptor subunit n=1 Tax=Aeoliella straminimaris TaxID=2954799 RepID=A0A9X2JHA8_9BACT|nr:efflux RND transporter periplasmic adaptor subunit [Aeoliella straminimaris]MCO6044443.1 efflux RND transporter periplasmic adaptor subunit [Aeoliella straminimaris]
MPAASETGSTSTEYVCPMHPDVRQDTPGNCYKCGMELVPVQSEATAKPEPADESSEQYICPMMCTPPHDEPGKCPVCGMDLVKSSATSGGNGRSVSIDAATRRILGIRTAPVTSEDVYRSIRTVGRIEYDEEQVATIAAYVDGRLEELLADYEGVEVAKGDPLAVLYSPQLYSAQVEYLSSLNTPALNALAGDDQQLSDVARDNLTELGMTAEQIEKLESTGKAQKRLRIAAPIGGTVITKHKVEGDYVKTGEPIYRVADLTMVWLMLDLYPSDAAAVRFGQQVEAELASLPGEIYTGRIAFVDPLVNEKTRTVAVRVEMSNFDRRLKPGDYATATVRVPAVPRDKVYDPALANKWISPMHPQIIRTAPGQCPICGMDLVPTSELGYASEPLSDQKVTAVPRSAVLMAGDNSVVYVETEPGMFELRQVAVGAMTSEQAVIESGLETGEQVAIDGNFLIDSQMQLTGKPSLMDPSKAMKDGGSSPQEAAHAH